MGYNNIIGHKIDYKEVGVLRGHRHIPSENCPPHRVTEGEHGIECGSSFTTGKILSCFVFVRHHKEHKYKINLQLSSWPVIFQSLDLNEGA